MKKLINEAKRMQQLAGIINESQLNNSTLKEVTLDDLRSQEDNPDVQKVDSVKFPNGRSFKMSGEDMEGGMVIGILKLKDGYAVSGMEYDPSAEGYTYYYDLEGNEVED
jgi:hypothetical protein